MKLIKQKAFLKKHCKVRYKLLAALGIASLAVIFSCFQYNSMQRIEGLSNQLSATNGALNDSQQKLADADERIKDLQKEFGATAKQQQKADDSQKKRLDAIEDDILDLQDKAANFSIINTPAPVVQQGSTNNSGQTSYVGPYDRITGNNPEVLAKVKRALSIIESKVPNFFSVYDVHVESLITGVANTSSCYGGVQHERTITMYSNPFGCMLSVSDEDVASTLLHEIKHIHSVYVEANYNTGKLQELPSLYLERDYADILGVSAYHRQSTIDSIDYWESQ